MPASKKIIDRLLGNRQEEDQGGNSEAGGGGRKGMVIHGPNGQVLVVDGCDSPEAIMAAMIQCQERTGRMAREVIDYDPLRQSLVDIEVNPEGTALNGRTRLYQSSWSTDFVHGAELALPIGIACEKLWKPDESLQTIKTLKFLSPVRSELDLKASTDPLPRNDQACITAQIQSDQGRVVHVQAVPNGKRVELVGNRNPVADDAFPRRTVGTETVIAITNDLGKRAVEALEGNNYPGFRMQTWADLINYLAYYVLQTRLPDKPQLSMVAGYDNLIVPNMVDMAKGGLQLTGKADWNALRKGKSGFSVVPVTVALKDTKKTVGEGTAYIAYTFDPQAAEQAVLKGEK